MAKNKNKNKNKNNHNHGEDHVHEHEHEEKEVKTESKQTKEQSQNNAVYKIEMHCDGCVAKIAKFAGSFDGVEGVKADLETNKLTLIGDKLDTVKIRDILQLKFKKKVELISPSPNKKDDSKDKNVAKNPKDDANQKSDNKPKNKEEPVITAVIKLAFHCQGCVEKIKKIVSKTKGVHEMTMDKLKETVTVKGTMDVKELIEVLKERFKRDVEIVPPKKEKDKDGGGDDSGGGGSDKKKKGGGDGGGKVVEGNKMEYMMQPGFGFSPAPGYGFVDQPVFGNGYMAQPMPMPVYGNGYMPVLQQPMLNYDYGYGYGYGYGQPAPGYPVHMKFNDENPDACSVM